MHNKKIAIADAKTEKWCEGCLVISEADARTIWVYDVELLKSPLMRNAATVANDAIEKMTESVNL
jgi:hypothetical protein